MNSLKNTLTFKEAIRIIDSGETFDCMVVKADKRHKTAGVEMMIYGARKHNYLTPLQHRNLKNANRQERTVLKNPNHYVNSTRNLVSPNGDITTVHIRLIKQINKHNVM